MYPIQSARAFPDSHDYAGGVVCLAFAFGFGLRCLRLDDYLAWLCGFVSSIASGSILIVEATTLSVSWEPFGRSGLADWLPISLMFLFWVLFSMLASVLINKSSLRRRRKLGLCVRCSYDLRGNESGVCPECGEPVTVGDRPDPGF